MTQHAKDGSRQGSTFQVTSVSVLTQPPSPLLNPPRFPSSYSPELVSLSSLLEAHVSARFRVLTEFHLSLGLNPGTDHHYKDMNVSLSCLSWGNEGPAYLALEKHRSLCPLLILLLQSSRNYWALSSDQESNVLPVPAPGFGKFLHFVLIFLGQFLELSLLCFPGPLGSHHYFSGVLWELSESLEQNILSQ